MFGLVCSVLLTDWASGGKWENGNAIGGGGDTGGEWVNNGRHTEPNTILFYLFMSFILFLLFDRSNLPWAPTSFPFIIFESPLQSPLPSPYLLFSLFPCKAVIFFFFSLFFNVDWSTAAAIGNVLFATPVAK